MHHTRSKIFHIIKSIMILSFSVIIYSSPIISVVYGQSPQVPATENSTIGYTLLEPLPCLGEGPGCSEGQLKTVNFETYVQYIFNLIIAVSAVAAVLVIVWGGFKYVTTDSFQGKSEGKQVIWQAVQGLILVLCSFIILRTIDPRLVSIPTTIVEPLKFDYQKGATGSFFSQVASEADRQDRIANEYAKSAKDARAAQNSKIDELEKEKAKFPANSPEAKKIQDQIDAYKNSEEYNDFEKVAQKDSTRMEIRKNISILLDKASVLYNRGNPGAGNTEIDGTIRYIDEIRDRKLEILNNLDNSEEAIQNVNNEANYGKAFLLIKKSDYLLNSNLGGLMKNKIVDDLSKAITLISLVKDPELKKELVTEFDKVNKKASSELN